MFELEDRYWWFVARRRLALGLLRQALSDPATGGRTPHGTRPASAPEASSDLADPLEDSPQEPALAAEVEQAFSHTSSILDEVGSARSEERLRAERTVAALQAFAAAVHVARAERRA